VSQRTPSFTTILCAATIAAGLAGCGRSETGAGAGMTAAGSTSAAVLRQLPGDLGSPIDGMTDGQLWSATENMVTLPEAAAQERKCRNGKCWGMIEAIDNQTAGPSNVSVNGTVVAVLKNFGDSPTGTGGADRGAEDKYGTEMNADKRFLLVARPDSVSGWRWAVRVAVRNGTKTPADSTAWGTWAVCKETQQSDNTHPKGKSAFYKCKEIKPGPGTATATFFVRNNIDAPGWLDCDQGCCTAGQ